MLQTVRKYTQGWVATVLGIILTLAFVFWGIENYLQGSSKKDVVAKVNGQEITGKDVEADYQRMILRVKEQLGSNFNLPPLMQQQFKHQALNNLVMQNVLVQAAVKSGFRVTNLEISAMVKQMPAFQENGHFSKERFYSILNR